MKEMAGKTGQKYIIKKKQGKKKQFNESGIFKRHILSGAYKQIRWDSN